MKNSLLTSYLEIPKAFLLKFSPKIRNKTRMSALATPIEHCAGGYSKSNHTRRKNKRHPDWQKFLKFNNKRTNNPMKIWAKKYFSKEDIQKTNY